MATRTAKGTTSDKISGTTLTLSNVSCNAGDALIVLVGNQTQNVPTSVTWGLRELNLSRQRTNLTSGHVGSIWIARNIVNTDTRNLTVTWGTAIVAKCMAALTLDSGHIRDQYASNVQTASTAPTTTATPAQTGINNFAVGILVSEGPLTNDTAPTLAAGWSTGQRIGTDGAPPVSNVTLIEGYKQLTDAAAQTLSGTGATERDWTNVLVTYREILQGVALDANGVEILVGDAVKLPTTGTTTVSSFSYTKGPFVKCVLANGSTYNAHMLEVVG